MESIKKSVDNLSSNEISNIVENIGNDEEISGAIDSIVNDPGSINQLMGEFGGAAKRGASKVSRKTRKEGMSEISRRRKEHMDEQLESNFYSVMYGPDGVPRLRLVPNRFKYSEQFCDYSRVRFHDFPMSMLYEPDSPYKKNKYANRIKHVIEIDDDIIIKGHVYFINNDKSHLSKDEWFALDIQPIQPVQNNRRKRRKRRGRN